MPILTFSKKKKKKKQPKFILTLILYCLQRILSLFLKNDITQFYPPALCPPGRYSKDGFGPFCDFCANGTYQDKAQQTSCLPCPKGTYTLHIGAIFCGSKLFDNLRYLRHHVLISTDRAKKSFVSQNTPPSFTRKFNPLRHSGRFYTLVAAILLATNTGLTVFLCLMYRISANQ